MIDSLPHTLYWHNNIVNQAGNNYAIKTDACRQTKLVLFMDFLTRGVREPRVCLHSITATPIVTFIIIIIINIIIDDDVFHAVMMSTSQSLS